MRRRRSRQGDTRDPRARHARRCRAVVECARVADGARPRARRAARVLRRVHERLRACGRAAGRAFLRTRPRRAGARRSRPASRDRKPKTPTSWTTSRCPLDNPWRRSVRASDIQFMKDGTGACVTLDGDVWFVRGLHESARDGPLAPFRIGTARAAVARDPRRAGLRLRSQRHLAPARHEWRRRSRSSTRCSRTPSRRPPTSASSPSTLRLAPRRRVRDRQGRPGGDDHRQAQRQRASHLGRRPAGDGARLRPPPAAAQRQHPHRPRHRERSAGALHSEHAPPHRPGPAVLRVPERQAAAGGLSRADCRPAHVDSARDQRVGDVAGLAVRRADGPAQRRARPHRLQQPGALSRAAQQPHGEAAGAPS